MERVGHEIARELGRFGAVSSMTPLLEAWPSAVGMEIARNAWPARVARDGTLHVHARDSIWAFELTARADEIRARLGALAPPRLAFSPGPLPELVDDDRLESVPRRPSEPTAEQVAKAESLVRVIRDEDLRKVVAKAIAASLSNGDNDRSFC
jgi:Dna[CI] antecedent, DciA